MNVIQKRFLFLQDLKKNLIPVWPVSKWHCNYHHDQYVFQQCLAAFSPRPCPPLGLFLSYLHKVPTEKQKLLEQNTVMLVCRLLASHQLTMWPLQTNLAGNWRGFPPLSTHGSKHCAILLVLVFISKSCSSLQASPGYCWGTAPLLPYGLTQLECQSQWASVNLHWRKSKWKSHGNRCCHWGCLGTGWANSSKYTLLSNSHLLYPLRPHGLRGLFQSSISQDVMTCPSP